MVHVIISHKHKFIFIKTRKTAGTSIEIALSEYLGKEDIITPITPEDEQIRKNHGFRGPQNYELPFSQYNPKDWLRFLLKKKRKAFYNHIPADLVRKYTEKSVWNNYFKFSVVRNPWDYLISLYFFMKKMNAIGDISFSEFVYSKRYPKNYDLLTIDDNNVMDFTCKYENLNEDLKYATRMIGLPNLELPRAKAGIRKSKDRENIYNKNTANFVSKFFHKDIKMFNYDDFSPS